jgi:hypothetical protein
MHVPGISMSVARRLSPGAPYLYAFLALRVFCVSALAVVSATSLPLDYPVNPWRPPA